MITEGPQAAVTAYEADMLRRTYDLITPSRYDHLSGALGYARMGFAVFPIVPRSKHPLTARGFKDASKDELVIRRWWEVRPDANIGIACGNVSRVVVLDVDTKGGQPGMESLTRLIAKVGEIETATVSTPSGGLHLYFRYPEGGCPSWKDGGLGLEMKSDGTYVLAPPSIVDYEKDGPPTGFYVANGDLCRDRFIEVPF